MRLSQSWFHQAGCRTKYLQNFMAETVLMYGSTNWEQNIKPFSTLYKINHVNTFCPLVKILQNFRHVVIWDGFQSALHLLYKTFM